MGNGKKVYVCAYSTNLLASAGCMLSRYILLRLSPVSISVLNTIRGTAFFISQQTLVPSVVYCLLVIRDTIKKGEGKHRIGA
jgi:hypothetical protein